jgi:hypothetical protein
MFKSVKFVWSMLLGAALLLGACGSQQAEPTATQIDPAAVYTAAAQTANARMTELAAITPTPPPATPTDTPSPATDTPAPTASPTSGDSTATATSQTAGLGADRAEFVSDISVPDGTQMQPGEDFVKTWRIKNIGESTWTTSYSLIYSSGVNIGVTSSVSLPAEVPPNTSVDISVEMTAPTEPGDYFSFWLLRNPSQETFGVGPNANQPIYVEINVAGEGEQAGTTETVVPGGDVITQVALSVDDANVEADCPYTFNFPAQFTLSGAATITYRLEAESDTAGFEFDLPQASSLDLGSGTHTLNFELELSNSVSGTLRLHITDPEDVSSAPVSFSLDCQ